MFDSNTEATYSLFAARLVADHGATVAQVEALRSNLAYLYPATAGAGFLQDLAYEAANLFGREALASFEEVK